MTPTRTRRIDSLSDAADPPPPLEWKSKIPSPYGHPDLPIEHRLCLAVLDGDPDSPGLPAGWGEGDGDCDTIRGLLAEHDYAHSVAIANALGLVGDWDEDDVTEAIASAADEHRARRAALDAARADAERLQAVEQRAREAADPTCPCGGCGGCTAQYILTGEGR